jgi:hypothetical protein
MKTLVLSTLMVFHMAAQSPQPPTAPHPKPGAPNAAPVNDPLVAEARAFIQKHLPLLRIESVQEATTQVVAGRSVRLVCRVKEEEGTRTWEFVVWRKLNGHWSLQSAKRTGD